MLRWHKESGLIVLLGCRSWGDAAEVAANFTRTFSLTCVMSWVCGHSESPLSPSQGQLLLSHHQSGSQCVRCFIQHSCVYFWHLAAPSERKEEQDDGVAGLQNTVTNASCFKPAGPLQAYIKQPEHLFPHSGPRLFAAQMKDRERFRPEGNWAKIKNEAFFFFNWCNRAILSWWMFWKSVWGWVYSRVKQLDFWC